MQKNPLEKADFYGMMRVIFNSSFFFFLFLYSLKNWSSFLKNHFFIISFCINKIERFTVDSFLNS